MRYSKTFSGYLPKNIKYVQREPRLVTDYWETDIFEAKTPKGIMVAEAFPVDATNPKTYQTAVRWAQGSYYVQESERVQPKVTEVPNDPIPTVEIVSLEIRGEGGRAWKALINGTFYVDLREDVLLDSLRNGEGVTKGELTGPFVWAVVGSHMKLVRVGSVLHEAVLEAGNRREKTVVSTKKLVVGGVYETKKGEKFVYAGQVDRTAYKHLNSKEQYYGRNNYKPEFGKSKETNFQMWVKWPKYEKNFEKWFETNNLYQVNFVKGKNVVGQVGKVTLPSDPTELVRAWAKEALDKYIRDRSSSRYSRDNLETDNITTRAYYGGWLTTRPTGQPCPEIPELDPLVQYMKDQPKTPKHETKDS